MQFIRQLGMYDGAYLIATSLHKLLKSVKEESATIIGAFPYFRAVAAPILLPQMTTLNFLAYSYLTTDAT